MNQTNLSLKKLKGIKPKGVKIKPSSTLETLSTVCDLLIDKYGEDHGIMWGNAVDDGFVPICNYVESDLLKDVEFTELDLETFVLAKPNQDYSVRVSKVIGFYTSALLSILTKRNSKKGKRTKLRIDGSGLTSDCLFHYAGHVDELILENFSGGNIGRHIAPNKDQEQAKLIAFANVQTSNSYSFFDDASGIVCGSFQNPVEMICSINSIYKREHSIDFSSAHALEAWYVNNWSEPDKMRFHMYCVNDLWLLNSSTSVLKINARGLLDNLVIINTVPNKTIDYIDGEDLDNSQKVKNMIVYDVNNPEVGIKNFEVENLISGKNALNQFKYLIDIVKTMQNQNYDETMNNINQIKSIYRKK